MTDGLQRSHDFDGDDAARCGICGARAAGPCARCQVPVCGDCCVLTEGSVRTYAICERCDRRAGRSLRGGWWTVAGWLLVPLLALGAAVVVLAWLTGVWL